jgi:UDP-N-acetylglucosamine 2-epimerase (non-hydrolysing)
LRVAAALLSDSEKASERKKRKLTTSMKRLIALVVGTRPEAIKMAPVYRELELSSKLRPFLLSTGQHREMLEQTLAAFDLKPDADLALMQKNQSLPDLSARVLQAVSGWLADVKPSALLVQGDTTTALAATLAAFYARVPVGHVEAGLRTYDFDAPWPEEMNRRLIDPISRWCFAPTEKARANLLSEKTSGERVFVTGNTVIDTLLWMRDRVRAEPPELPPGLTEAIAGREMVLVTGHRRESFGEGFENICYAIRQIAEEFPQAVFVYPVHMNPNVREPVGRILGQHDRIHLFEPLPYAPFVSLLDKATIVLTDSGGVQEEAPSLGKPVLVMRETTERPEGITSGNARLVGVRRESIVAGLRQLLASPSERAVMSDAKNPYGDGQAGKRIVTILETP